MDRGRLRGVSSGRLSIPDTVLDLRLLDTNHAGRIVQQDSAALSHLTQLRDEQYAINVVVEAELLFMALHSARQTENLAAVLEFLSSVRILPLTSGTARLYAEIKSEIYRHFGPAERAARRRTTVTQLGFQENDLWIAATAIQHDLVVVSADSDFTRISEVRPLRIESWIAPEGSVARKAR